jgi:hypothetical protein
VVVGADVVVVVVGAKVVEVVVVVVGAGVVEVVVGAAVVVVVGAAVVVEVVVGAAVVVVAGGMMKPGPLHFSAGRQRELPLGKPQQMQPSVQTPGSLAQTTLPQNACKS